MCSLAAVVHPYPAADPGIDLYEGWMARQRHPSRLREAGGSMRGDVAPLFVEEIFEIDA